MITSHAFHPYSIGGGGLLAQVDSWLRLPPNAEWAWRRRAVVYVLIAYVPILLVGVTLRVTTGHWDPVIALVDTHVRALVAGPMLLLAEHLVDLRARVAGKYLLAAEIIRGDEVTSYRQVVERTERLRNSSVADGVMLLMAVAFDMVDTRSVFNIDQPPHFWGSFAGVTLFRFLLLRWLWRWTLWAIFLRRVARMPLALSSLHPDRVGGLAELSGPSESFAVLAAAGAATLAGAWFERMRDGVPLAAFYGAAATYVIVVVAIAVGPLLVFTRELYRLRRKGRFGFGAFARRYCEAFQREWLGRSGEEALGAPDIQSLADLGGSYSVLAEMRIVVCERRLLVTIAAASVIPMLPLALVEFSVLDLLLRILKAIA